MYIPPISKSYPHYPCALHFHFKSKKITILFVFHDFSGDFSPTPRWLLGHLESDARHTGGVVIDELHRWGGLL